MYGNTKLTIMPILAFLCGHEKPEYAQVVTKQESKYIKDPDPDQCKEVQLLV